MDRRTERQIGRQTETDGPAELLYQYRTSVCRCAIMRCMLNHFQSWVLAAVEQLCLLARLWLLAFSCTIHHVHCTVQTLVSFISFGLSVKLHLIFAVCYSCSHNQETSSCFACGHIGILKQSSSLCWKAFFDSMHYVFGICQHNKGYQINALTNALRNWLQFLKNYTIKYFNAGTKIHYADH